MEGFMKRFAKYSIVLQIFYFAIVGAPQERNLDARIDQELPGLLSTYKTLHQAPELSHYEARTSAFIASQLRAMGYDVTEHVGKYQRPD